VKSEFNLRAWQLLASLEKNSGMTGASVELGMDLALCTRIIQRLEKDLGIVLVNHMSCPAQLTPEARMLLPAVKDMLRSFERVRKAAKAAADAELTIRFSIPLNSPRQSFYSLIKAYEAVDPNLRIQFVADMDHDDVLSGRVDMAYLPYRPPAEGLLIHDICRQTNVPFAAPSYLRKYGVPRHPRELEAHRIIVRAARHYPHTKTLEKDGEVFPLKCRDVAFAGDALSAKTVALAGDGIAIDLSYVSCLPEVEQGSLVPVLNGWHRPDWEISCIMRRENIGNARMVRFMQWFSEKETEAAESRRAQVESVLRQISSAASESFSYK
jgi:DNA-binding transcriptional LysR family regulator